MKKRLFALLLTLCMVFSLMPAQAVVAEGTATDLTLDANQIGTFTPTTSGTYVFYDTTSQNENGNEWGISIQYATGDNTYADVGVAVNDTYNTRGYRAELTANTTYTVVANNNSNRTLSLKVAPAAYGGEISFSKLAEEAKGAIVGGQWGLDVVPVAPNGVLGQVDWSAVVSATDDTTTDCVDVTEKGECVTLDFIKEGTFLLKATCGEKGCSMEITIQDAPAEPPQGGDEGGSGDGPPRLELFEQGTSKTVSFDSDNGVTEHRYMYSCMEDAVYTIYYTYEDSSSGVQVNIYEAGAQDALPKEQWFAWMGGNQYAEGERWNLQEGTMYELVFTCGRTISEEYSFDKVVAPTGMRYAQNHISNFVGSGDQLNVVFEPVYASAEVTHAVTANNPEGDNASGLVAEVTTNEWASSVNMLNPGTATLTATAKISDDLTLSATATVTSRAPIALKSNAEPVMTDTENGVRVRYSFTPAESGEYTFDFTAPEKMWIRIWNPAEDENAGNAFSANWSVNAGESNPYTVFLENGKVYTIDVSADYTNLEIFASVTGGNQGVGVPEQNIHVSANSGTMSYTGFDGQRYEDCDAYSGLLEEGKSLADMGFEMTDDDVKYWTDRALQGWRLEIQTPIYNENGEWIDSNWDSLGGLLTTEEVINYTIPDGRIYYFHAQWEGDNSDYVAFVLFDAMGGNITIERGDGPEYHPDAGSDMRIDGTTIGEQLGFTITGVTGEPAWGTFQGWLACERLGEVAAMKSTTVYTFDQIKAMTVEEDLLLIPKWSGVALEDYAEQFNVLMPVDHIAMTVGVKYDVAAESTAYFKFTAPADGAYMLRTDAHQGIDSEMALNMDGWQQPFFDPMGVTLEMTKGETVKFMATATQAAKVWVEDVNEVVKMELVSQDKTATYILDEFFNPEGTLKDVVLKVTFEDGTVIEGNGEEVFQKAFWGNNGVLVEGFVEEDGDKVTVGWESGSAKVSYPIALDKATVTGFEVIPAADMFDIYEGTMCYEEDGEFVYEEAVAASAQLASYKFTWSDGTVEVYQPDPEADLYYHGTLIFYHTVYPSGWTAGTHNVPIAFGELTDDLPVIIKENNIKSIKLLSLGVDQYTLGDPDFFEKSGNGWVMNSYDISEYELQVNYVDGTSKILTEEDETDFRGLFALLDNTIVGGDIEQKVHTAPGKNKVYMVLAGQIAEYEVSIVEQAVVDGNASVSESTINELLADRQGNTVTLSVAQENTTVSGAKFPTAAVENLLDEKVNHLVVELGTATVTLDEKALTAIADQAEGATITMSVVATEVKDLSEKQQEALKNKNVEVVLTALILSDGEPIGDFKGGSVKVTINFKPEKGYNYKVVYVADDGTTTDMTTEVDENSLAFWTGHFSDYVVVKEVANTGNPAVPNTGNPAVPNTGDSSNVMGMTVVMLTSAMLAAALWLALRKRNAV